ncbi:hypothetical protein BFW01_g4513 [Lasiodiplodia theobromae]|nr:hypothetical protein BFW01_g4513 [Lasiodiplodia theobromae]
MRGNFLIAALAGAGAVTATSSIRYTNSTSSAVIQAQQLNSNKQESDAGVYHTTVIDTIYRTALTTKVETTVATQTQTAYSIVQSGSSDVVLNESSWTTVAGPITTLQPATPPGHDASVLTHLAPKDTGSFYFNEGSSSTTTQTNSTAGSSSTGGSSSSSSSGSSSGSSSSGSSSSGSGSSSSGSSSSGSSSTGSSSSADGSLFALMKANFTYPSVILDNSAYITRISVISGGLEVDFATAEAFQYAQRAWGSTTGWVVVTSSVAGVNATVGQHTYWLVSSETFTESSHSCTLNCAEIPIEQAIGDVEVKWGTVLPTDGSVNGTTSLSGNSTLSTSGSVFSNSTGGSSTSQSGSSSSCGAPPEATISGFPTAPCGDDFDKVLDDKLGYYDFDSDFSSSLQDFAPGLGDYSEDDYDYDDTAETSTKLRRRSYGSPAARASAIVRKRWSLKSLIKKIAPKAISQAIDKVDKKLDDLKNMAIKVADKYTNGAVSKGIKFINDKIDSLTTAKPEGNFNINLTPSNKVDSKYWGSQYQLYHGSASGALTGTVDLYCVDCGITGNAHVAGEIGFSLLGGGFNKGSVTIDGSAKAALYLGLAADGTYNNKFKKNIASYGAPGFSIPNVISVGPVMTMDASLTLDIKAQGQILVGAEAAITNFYAKLDIVNKDQTTIKNFKPTFTTKFTASGEISADARVGLPLTVGVGLEITPLKYRKLISITNEPYVAASAKYAYDSVNPGTCNGGVSYALTLGDELSMDFFGLSQSTIWKADAQAMAAQCVLLPGGSSSTGSSSTASTTSGSTVTDGSASSGSTATADGSSTSGSTTTDGSSTSGSTTTDGSTTSGSTEGSTSSGSTTTEGSTSSSSTSTEGSTSSGSTSTEGSASSGSTTTEGSTSSDSTTSEGSTSADSTSTDGSASSGSTTTEGSTSSGSTDDSANTSSTDSSTSTGSTDASSTASDSENTGTTEDSSNQQTSDSTESSTATNSDDSTQSSTSAGSDEVKTVEGSTTPDDSTSSDESSSVYKRQDSTDSASTTSTTDASTSTDGDDDGSALSTDALLNIATDDADTNTDGFTYTTLTDTTGAWHLSADEDTGVLGLQAVGDADAGLNFAAYSNVVVSDDADRVFIYHPDEMDKLGASRFRLAGSDEIPKNADIITLMPVDDSSTTTSGGIVVAVDSQGNAFYMVVCNVDDDSTKFFLVSDPDEGAATLEKEEMKWVLVGGVASDCSAMAFTVGGGLQAI